METPDILTGSFGPYQIQKVLGQGGMATVYLARHPDRGKIALKVLHQHLVKRPEVLHRFWREMRLADKLQHPRIVRVLDAGVEGDRFYLAMDWIDGPSLFEFERDTGPLPIRLACTIMREVLEALHSAHQASMVHRDLKPENILLDSNREPFVSDFGIAKHLEGTKLTQTGTTVGTPYYMSPEQIRSAKEVGPAADIYSAGVLFYEMVTGAVPYTANDPMEVARQHIHGAPVAPTSLRRDLPRELELVILKAMEKKPEDRFKSARFMIKAIEMAEAGEATGIRLVSKVEYRGQGMQVGALLLIVVGAFFLALLVVRPNFAVHLRHELGQWVGGEAEFSAPVAPTKAAVVTPRPPVVQTGEAQPKPGAPPADPGKLPELIEGGYWTQARRAARRAGNASEVFADAWAKRIRELLNRKDLVDARLSATEFNRAYPGIFWGPFLLAETALAEGKQREAAENFSEGFRLAPVSQVESFFERYRPSLRDLGLEARQVVKEKLAKVAEMRLKAAATDEAIMLLRHSSRIYETSDTHDRIAELYQRQGRRSKAKWHRKRAATLAEEGR